MSRIVKKLAYQLLRKPLGRGNPWAVERWQTSYEKTGPAHTRELSELAHYSVLAGYARHLCHEPHILDVACGPARLAELFAPLPFASYLGFDYAPSAIAQGRAFVERLGLANTALDVSDFETFTSERTFDLVVFCECLNHADFPERVLSRFLPYVTPGGVVLASMFDKSASRARWRRLETTSVDVQDETRVTNARGQSWTVKVLRPRP